MVFQNERFSVSQISSVIKYSPDIRKIYKFPGKLPTYELMYFYKGNIRLEFHNKSFHIKPGDVVYLPKGVENNCYRILAENGYGVYNIYFDTSDPLPMEAVHIPLQSEKLKSIYDAIYLTWIGKRQGYYYKTMQLFYEILQVLIKVQGSYSKHKESAFYALLEEYMIKHFCDGNFNYQELAKVSGFSYSYFKKVFIAKYGVSPVKHITQRRIDYACELLCIGKYSVSDVAQLCGYENVYYFSTVFKKHKGISPQNYVAATKGNARIPDGFGSR